MDGFVKDIPQTLVYEMDDGNPIFYRDYKEYLTGAKDLEEIIGSSYLQSLIVTQIIIFLSQKLNLTLYQILSNEVGLKFSHNSWRAADIAIFEKAKIKSIPKDNKYLETAPKIVIEIDTKAHLDEIQNPLGYYQEKTDQLLNFGVEKVIWIFTDTEKVMFAEKDKDWQISNWSKNITVLEGVEINISQIVKDFQ